MLSQLLFDLTVGVVKSYFLGYIEGFMDLLDFGDIFLSLRFPPQFIEILFVLSVPFVLSSYLPAVMVPRGPITEPLLQFLWDHFKYVDLRTVRYSTVLCNHRWEKRDKHKARI